MAGIRGGSNTNPRITATQTLVETSTDSSAQIQTTAAPPILVLNLRGSRGPQITWTEDTIDNEHLNRKSSKRCCIFHKVKKFAESDSDETESEDENEGEGKHLGKDSGEGGED